VIGVMTNDRRSEDRSEPNDPRATIAALCRYIDAHASEKLALSDLAARAGFSRFHLQRRFREVTGVSPKVYQNHARLRALKGALRNGSSVTDAIHDAGYGSSSRLYEFTSRDLGMTPSEYRAGGSGVRLSYALTDSMLGPMLLAASDRGVCFVQFDDDRAVLEQRLADEYPGALREPMRTTAAAPFSEWMDALDQHLRGFKPQLNLPLDLRGTAFQLTVWRYLQQIPYGETRTYSEVATALGKPRAVRAVASACARNRIALAIPCHRVIRGDGGLGGYRWGLERKQQLLQRERLQA
jgi:AraC family transcriptional regulator, regulatory protein of adaptative response / methylated-DNA-[protein]-cysteine methyltransferase